MGYSFLNVMYNNNRVSLIVCRNLKIDKTVEYMLYRKETNKI